MVAWIVGRAGMTANGAESGAVGAVGVWAGGVFQDPIDLPRVFVPYLKVSRRVFKLST